MYKLGTIFYYKDSSKISDHHQVPLTEEETIITKLKFDREAIGEGVLVESYSTYNGIYTSKEFTRYLHGKGQLIRERGVGGRNHNGVSENEIRNVVLIAKNIMINAALIWPYDNNKSLLPMAMSHAVHLHNRNPHIYIYMSP